MAVQLNTTPSALQNLQLQSTQAAGAVGKLAAPQEAKTAVVHRELAKDNALAAKDRDAAAKAPANKGGKVGGVPMGPWALKSVDSKPVSQLLSDPGVTAQAAAETHMAWLSGGNKPGVRLVKDDPILSMQKAGLDVTGLKPEDAGARLAELGLEIGPKHRTFAFAVDASLTPMPKNAAEAKVLDVLGKDTVKKQITDNNLPAIQGVAGALTQVLSGVKPSFITADEGYEAAVRTQFQGAQGSKGSGKADRAAITQLTQDVEAYQAALKAAGEGDIKDIGKQHPAAHAIAGMVHDQFTGYRKEKGIYMDDAQVVPYEKLAANVAVLDLDPVLALLRSANASMVRQDYGSKDVATALKDLKDPAGMKAYAKMVSDEAGGFSSSALSGLRDQVRFNKLPSAQANAWNQAINDVQA